MAKPHTSIKALKRAIKSTPGVYARKTQRGHYQVLDDDGVIVGTFPSTPSEYRGLKNSISAMKRNGLDLYHRTYTRK